MSYWKAGRRPSRVVLSVMDIACGKGGDLRKFRHAGVRNYVGNDISSQGVKDAHSRWKGDGRKFAARFYEMDATSPSDVFYKHVPQDMFFNLVSCQFSLHYMFAAEEKAN